MVLELNTHDIAIERIKYCSIVYVNELREIQGYARRVEFSSISHSRYIPEQWLNARSALARKLQNVGFALLFSHNSRWS